MSRSPNRNPLWPILLVAFAGINVYAIAIGTFGGLVTYLQTLGPWGTLATADLLVALTIGLGWLWRDARRRGLSPWPYLVLTLATGSIGLLVYLVRYGTGGEAETTAPRSAAAAGATG